MGIHKLIVSIGNKAHLHPSPWVRRPVIAMCVIALALHLAVFWSLVPVLALLIIAFETGKAFVTAVAELPSMVVASLREDRRDWAFNIRGAMKVWRAQKDSTND